MATEILDVSTLAASQGFVIQGDAAGDKAGTGVGAAGDLNGDGFADVIVGAPYGPGRAYVIFGSAGPIGTSVSLSASLTQQVLDLTGMGSAQGLVLSGRSSGDLTGHAVASAGDVNGDGIDDVIVGAWLAEESQAAGEKDEGEAYIVFGSHAGFGSGSLNLASLSATQGFAIRGDAASNYAGFSVHAAGDVNGDGIGDVIVGARGVGGVDGAAYVLFGTTGSFGSAVGGRQVIDLSSFSSTQGFVIRGDTDSDGLGFDVSSVGDINGDGIDDVIASSPFGDAGGFTGGIAYVIFGSATAFGAGGLKTINVGTLTPSQGFVLEAGINTSRAGESVAGGGDINGDGYDDLLIGAPARGTTGDHTMDPGSAYVVFGTTQGFGTADGAGRLVVNLASLDSAHGATLNGTGADSAGYDVAMAGDFNGDGYDDLLIGAANGGSLTNNSNLLSGITYLVFGTASGLPTNLASMTPTQGFEIRGDAKYDTSGTSVDAAGDVNGDGFDDIIIGAPYNGDGGEDAGSAYVIFGHATGATTPIVQTGGIAADTFVGGPGQDTLSGGGGADVLRGGAGDDTFTVGDGTYREIDGGSGDDTLILGAGGGTVDLSSPHLESVEHFVAGAGNDRLAGAAAGDSFAGGAGNDTLDGAGGDDQLSGGDDNNSLFGGTGLDEIGGGAGADTAFGGDNDDVLLGDDRDSAGSSNDVLYGGNQADFVDAGDGNDGLNGDANDDWLRGGGGDDRISGGDQADFADGQDGSDIVYGGDLAGDVLVGGAGDDTLFGGDNSGVDDDWLFGDGLSGTAPDGGNDVVYGGSGKDYVFGGDGNDRVYGGNDADAIDGDGGNDTLLGDAGPDLVLGGAGNDSLLGGTEADTLFGGDGDDRLDGGSGAGDFDLMLGGAGNDTFFVGANYGNDTIGDWNDGDKVFLGVGGSFPNLVFTPIAGGMHVTAAGLDLVLMLDAGETLDTDDFVFLS